MPFSPSPITEFTQKKTGQTENERRERKNINKEKKCLVDILCCLLSALSSHYVQSNKVLNKMQLCFVRK